MLLETENKTALHKIDPTTTWLCFSIRICSNFLEFSAFKNKFYIFANKDLFT